MDMFSIPWGGLSVMFGYTDSDQLRVPEFKTEIAYIASVKGYKFNIAYNGLFERGVDFNGTVLDDIDSIDYGVSKEFDRLTVKLSGRALLDNDAEMMPGFYNGGSQFFLTFVYR